MLHSQLLPAWNIDHNCIILLDETMQPDAIFTRAPKVSARSDHWVMLIFTSGEMHKFFTVIN